jgi:hypothetical protein
MIMAEQKSDLEKILEKMYRQAKKRKEESIYCLRGNVLVSFPAAFEKELDEIKRAMNDAFGGLTQWSGEGCWVNPENKLVCEPVVVLYSAHDCFKDREKAAKFLEKLLKMGEEAKQESVFINTEGVSFIVSPKAFLKGDKLAFALGDKKK